MRQDLDSSTAFGTQDRRAAVERANEERAALRLSRIEEQSSPLLSIQERVQRWESLHGLRLPIDPNHKLIRIIALDTALTAEQVRAEQVRRKAPIAGV